MNWRFKGNEQKYLKQIFKFGIQSKNNNFNKKLETAWSKYHNLKYSITTNSCTSALHSAFLSLNLNRDDEVLVPALTPIMCGSTVHLAGGTPIYVDVNKDSFLMDYEDLKLKISKNTKAILAVHMYSGVCDLKKLKKICSKHKLILIEDCAEAVGARDNNNILVGTAGDISCWSFQSAKQLTCGDGGIISTNSKNFAKKIRKNSNLGFKSLDADGDKITIKKNDRQNPSYKRFDKIGYNYRMNQFSAAIALAQFENIDYFIKKRRRMGIEFEKNLKKNKYFKIQKISPNTFSTYYTFAAILKNNNKIRWKNFRKKFIENGGDPIYAASKLIPQEPAIKKNLIGKCSPNCKHSCLKTCNGKGVPNAEYLQRNLFLFTTNQRDQKDIKVQIHALKKTLKFFEIDNEINLGIFQGRLTNTPLKILQKFPNNWENEFTDLKKIEFDYIELYLEEKLNQKNPFWTISGRKKIKKYLETQNHKKLIVCDTYCLENSLYKKNVVDHFKKVINILSTFRNKKLIIAIQNTSNNFNSEQFINKIDEITMIALKSNIELSFETDNFNDDLVKYIKKRKKKFNSVGLTFDVGNIFLKNKNVNRVFRKNQNIINHIHLKDRNMYNQNVELGKGLINFKSFFKTLMKQNYNGEITLETHRGKNAYNTAIKNKLFMDKYI